MKHKECIFWFDVAVLQSVIDALVQGVVEVEVHDAVIQHDAVVHARLGITMQCESDSVILRDVHAAVQVGRLVCEQDSLVEHEDSRIAAGTRFDRSRRYSSLSADEFTSIALHPLQ